MHADSLDAVPAQNVHRVYDLIATGFITAVENYLQQAIDLLCIGQDQDSDLMFGQRRNLILLTIYEKESLFESLDETFAEIEANWKGTRTWRT